MKKRIALILSLVMLLSMTACGKLEPPEKENTKPSGSDTIYTEPADTQNSEPTVPAATAPMVPEATQPTQEMQQEGTAKPDEQLQFTGDWKDMQFKFDGVCYQIPFAYQELEAAGWTFDMADYGYENGYVLNPRNRVVGTIRLENPNYPDDLIVYIGLVNNSDEILDITQCDVWCLDLDTCYGFDQLEAYPDMVIGNGIRIGSTRSEVEAACGPCDDIYETGDGYAFYSYDVDTTYQLSLTIYDDIGVTAIELQLYE